MVSVPITAQRLYSEDMFEYILSRVTGTHSLDERLNFRPSRRFIVGTLAPRKEEGLHEDGVDEGRASIRARMMKVSFLAKRASVTRGLRMQMEVSGYVYYPVVLRTIVDNKNQDKEKLKEIDEGLPAANSSDDDGEQAVTSGKSKELQWKRLPFKKEFFIDVEADEKQASFDLDFAEQFELANSDKDIAVRVGDDVWAAQISIEREEFTDLDDMVSIYLTNNAVQPRDPPRKERPLERTLFDCKLRVKLDDSIVVSEFKDDYSYENHEQVYFYDFRTINCQAYWLDKARLGFATRHYGIYKQDRIL